MMITVGTVRLQKIRLTAVIVRNGYGKAVRWWGWRRRRGRKRRRSHWLLLLLLLLLLYLSHINRVVSIINTIATTIVMTNTVSIRMHCIIALSNYKKKEQREWAQNFKRFKLNQSTLSIKRHKSFFEWMNESLKRSELSWAELSWFKLVMNSFLFNLPVIFIIYRIVVWRDGAFANGDVIARHWVAYTRNKSKQVKNYKTIPNSISKEKESKIKWVSEWVSLKESVSTRVQFQKQFWVRLEWEERERFKVKAKAKG